MIEMPLKMAERMRELLLNESFAIEPRQRSAAFQAARRNFEGTGKKFTVRLLKSAGQYRVWRIA